MSKRSRCGAVRTLKLAGEPSPGFARVEKLSFWCHANFKARRQTLCGSRACRNTLAVTRCESQSSPANPLRGSCVSKRSAACCGAMQISKLVGELSGGFMRVETLSLVLGGWRRWRVERRQKSYTHRVHQRIPRVSICFCTHP